MEAECLAISTDSKHDLISSRWSKALEYDWSHITSKLKKTVHMWDAVDLEGVEFDTVGDAEQFYHKYACIMGFSVRKDDIRISTKLQITQRRRWVCSREGIPRVSTPKEGRQRQPRRLSRCGCNAAFRVHYSKNQNKYIVGEFKTMHNHDLAGNHEGHYLRSQRCIDEAAKEVQTDMRRVGVLSSQIMDYMVVAHCGYKNVGFTRKDLYNWIDSECRVGDLATDSEKALAHLTSRAHSDLDFYCRYAVDGDNMLRYLFWADGGMRRDYQCFGDIICFDATYNTNGYKLPYVVILGVNHHFMTTVFGCGLVTDESETCFSWLLSRFTECMGGKTPTAVITDSAPGIKLAIQASFPDARHRLCSWHLLRNCRTNVKECAQFPGVFANLMLHVDNPVELEAKWAEAVEEHGLSTNVWVTEIWQKRALWAIAYLKGTFFAGMTSTQRSEGMHCFQKRFLGSQLKLYDFGRRLDVALDRIREAEVQENFFSQHTQPQYATHLKLVEKHAGEMYTPRMFNRVREHILDEPHNYAMCIEHVGVVKRYNVYRYASSATHNVVTYDTETKKFECTCKVLTYTGIPCSHIFSVLKVENIFNIPESLILHRWTKDAKKEKSYGSSLFGTDVETVHMAKRNQLSNICNKFIYFASRCDGEVYTDLKRKIGQLTIKAAERCEACQVSGNGGNSEEQRQIHGIRDPIRVKVKKGRGKAKIKKASTSRTVRKKRRHCTIKDCSGDSSPSVASVGKVANIVESQTHAPNHEGTDVANMTHLLSGTSLQIPGCLHGVQPEYSTHPFHTGNVYSHPVAPVNQEDSVSTSPFVSFPGSYIALLQSQLIPVKEEDP